MTNDLAAREQALDATASFIVQAPAGSGKTEVLIQRYLKLLTVATVPEAVVAITFTKKASAEIRSRVIHSLRQAVTRQHPQAAHQQITAKLAHEVLIRDGVRGWGLLENPARLRVDTIDALCASIARQMPWLARFGAMPEITEKAGDLYREAARNTLAMYADGGENAEAIGALLLHLDNDFGMAERLLAQMLEKRDQWLRHTGGEKPNMEEVRKQIEWTLERLIEESLMRVHAAFPESLAARVVDLASYAKRERSTGALPGKRANDLTRWHGLADLFLTSGGEWRRKIDKNQGFPPRDRRKRECEDLLKDLQGEAALLEALKEVSSLPPAQFDESQWKAMVAVIAVLPLTVAQLEMTFRERGRVDFAQLSIAATCALGRVDAPSDLALALGERIEHILVDEFQDTSQTQYSLLESLTSGWSPGDGRTLFLVGDPMQSIYRFRQAEVGLFLKARQEGIGAIRFKALTLRTNFRSQPGIVRWVNETFGAILPQQEDIRAGAVTYSPSEAAGDREEGPMPIIVPFFGDSAKAEAKRVATLVKESGDGSTAILVRARSHLTHIVAELKQRGIRFQAIEIDELGQRPVIQDLLALTFALLHLADRTSWLAVLRAPWCGLTLMDLYALATGGDSIWTALQRHDLALSEDGKLRLARVVPVLAQALAQRGRQTLRMWVEDTWLRLGGSSCLREEADAEDAMAYFDVLAGLEEGSDLTDFEALRVQVRELFAQPDAKATESLQVMTIHKAKGLEFDTVIVPGLGRGAKPDDAQLLLWQEVSEDELLLAPISAGGKDKDPIYRYLQRIEKEKTEHEGVRLLYVAATRARSRLYLLGHVEETTQKSGARAMAGPYKGSFLKSLWDREGPTFAAAYAARVVQGVATTEEPAVRKLRRVPADWKAPGPNPVLTWTGPLDDPSEVERVSFDWAGDTLRHIGTAVHAYLQRIAREGLDRWHEEAVRAQRGGYRALLANLGVPPDTLETAVMRTETALLRCLADPRARWIIEPHQSAASESELTGVVDGRVYQVVIDRTFIDNDGTRWVIDYKTSVHEGGGIEKFLDNERARYQATLDRYARLMQQLEQRPVKLGLYFPLLNGWREWEASPLVMRQASLFGD